MSPTAQELWKQSGGDLKKFRELCEKLGLLVRSEPPPVADSGEARGEDENLTDGSASEP